MASVFKRSPSSKNYSIEYTDEFGNVRRIAGFRDKRSSQEYARQLEETARRKRLGLPVDEKLTPRPLTEALEAFYAELERLGRSASHLANVKGFLQRMAKACGWEYLQQINQENVNRFLADLHAKGRSPRTQNAYLEHIVLFLNWCTRQRDDRQQPWLSENPLKGIPKASTKGDGRRPRRRRALTPAEFQRLTAEAKIPARRRHVYRVAGLSGLRHEELSWLELRDFTLGARPQWHLRAEITKGRHFDRIPMLPECAALLEVLCQGKTPTERVFPSVPIPRTFNRDLKRAGVVKRDDQARQADFHSLRYFFCTLAGAQLPIQKVRVLMRHRDIRTTCNLYMDLNMQDVFEENWTLPQLLTEPPV